MPRFRHEGEFNILILKRKNLKIAEVAKNGEIMTLLFFFYGIQNHYIFLLDMFISPL